MTGIISGIKRMEIHDGDGLRTTVFFKGCTLKCIWCHNPESISFDIQTAFFKDKCMGCGLCGGVHSQATAESCPVNAQVLYGKEYESRALAEILAKDKAFFDNSGGGVTFSGGECLAQHEFAAELAKILKGRIKALRWLEFATDTRGKRLLWILYAKAALSWFSYARPAQSRSFLHEKRQKVK